MAPAAPRRPARLGCAARRIYPARATQKRGTDGRTRRTQAQADETPPPVTPDEVTLNPRQAEGIRNFPPPPLYDPKPQAVWGEPESRRLDTPYKVPPGGRPPEKDKVHVPSTPLSTAYRCATLFWVATAVLAFLAPLFVSTGFPHPHLLQSPLAPGGVAPTPLAAVAVENTARLSFFAAGTAQMCQRMNAAFTLVLAVICFRLEDAELHNRLKSDTYKRMNLALGMWGALTTASVLASASPAFVTNFVHVPGVFVPFFYPLALAKTLAAAVACAAMGCLGFVKGARAGGDEPLACLRALVADGFARVAKLLGTLDVPNFPRGWFEWAVMLFCVGTAASGALLIANPYLVVPPEVVSMIDAAQAAETAAARTIPAAMTVAMEASPRVGPLTGLWFPLTAVASVTSMLELSVRMLGATMLCCVGLGTFVSVDAALRNRSDGTTFLALNISLFASCLATAVVALAYVLSPLMVHSAVLSSPALVNLAALVVAVGLLASYAFLNAWIRGYVDKHPVVAPLVASIPREEAAGHLSRSLSTATVLTHMEAMRALRRERLRRLGSPSHWVPAVLRIGLW